MIDSGLLGFLMPFLIGAFASMVVCALVTIVAFAWIIGKATDEQMNGNPCAGCSHSGAAGNARV